MSRTLLVALLAAASVCLAEDKTAPAPATPEAHARGIRAGMGYLQKNLLSLPDVQGTPREPFTWAVAGLDALLAPDVLGQATAPGGDGDFLRHLQTRIEGYLAGVEKQLQDPRNLPSSHGMADSSKLCQYTWPLGMAGLLFAEMRLRGVRPDDATRDMQRILVVLQGAQEANGGWGHGRVSGLPDARMEQLLPKEFRKLMANGGGYPATLLSSTNCVAPALGVWRRIGLAVPSLDKARRYYAEAQLSNGNMPYDPSQRSATIDDTGAPRVAGAIFALLCMGASADDAVVAKGRGYLADHMEYLSEGHGSATYGLMDGALACRALGAKEWQDFDRRYAGRLLATQGKDGALGCVCEGKAFGTSCDKQFGMNIPMIAGGTNAYLTAIDTLILLLDRAHPKVIAPPAKTVRTK